MAELERKLQGVILVAENAVDAHRAGDAELCRQHLTTLTALSRETTGNGRLEIVLTEALFEASQTVVVGRSRKESS